MTALVKYRYSTDLVRCGQSAPEWHTHPELAYRMCLLPVGHDGVHIAHQYDLDDPDDAAVQVVVA